MRHSETRVRSRTTFFLNLIEANVRESAAARDSRRALGGSNVISCRKMSPFIRDSIACYNRLMKSRDIPKGLTTKKHASIAKHHEKLAAYHRELAGVVVKKKAVKKPEAPLSLRAPHAKII